MQRIREQLVMCILPMLILGISLVAWVVNMVELRQASLSDSILWWFTALGSVILAPLLLFGVPYYRRRPLAGLITSFCLLMLCVLARQADYWPDARTGVCLIAAGVGGLGTIGYMVILLLVMLRQTTTNYLKCTNCSYDLRGNHSGRCPECGMQIPARQKRVLDEVTPEPSNV